MKCKLQSIWFYKSLNFSLSYSISDKKYEEIIIFFFQLLLKDVDSIIYVDTDVLMLRPPEDLWGFFSRFNSTQLAGMAPEGEVDAIGWYNRFARHPYYGRLGVNSGVMLMNLTRMRRINWNDDVYPIYKHYRYDITWGDQDILNIMFHFKPGNTIFKDLN